MGLGSPTQNAALGVSFQPMQHRHELAPAQAGDADATCHGGNWVRFAQKSRGQGSGVRRQIADPWSLNPDPPRKLGSFCTFGLSFARHSQISHPSQVWLCFAQSAPGMPVGPPPNWLRFASFAPPVPAGLPEIGFVLHISLSVGVVPQAAPLPKCPSHPKFVFVSGDSQEGRERVSGASPLTLDP
jgi:hypothetical protein